ncbi:MAG: nicotinate-nucleotide adenylyltransferase [Bacillota bacterium]|nr:nicotinate-nucleotide adenylyltransferase [Bacillota bacterium]
MSFEVRKLGIMGGTFDPIHYGHLVTAEAVRTEFDLDQVVFVPSGLPPHKDPATITPPQHRYLMAVLATLTNPHFEVSRVDIDRPGVTYTVDTLADLRREYGPEVEFYFITGADALAEIFSWKNAEELVRECTFVGATRPGFTLEHLSPEVEEFYHRNAASFRFIEVPALAISSTDLRRRIREGRSLRYLTPEEVVFYIKKNGLYRKTGENGPEEGGTA